MIKPMAKQQSQDAASRWTAVTVPRTGDFQTLYKRLEKVLREESNIPVAGKIPVHVVCTLAMRFMLEAKDKGR